MDNTKDRLDSIDQLVKQIEPEIINTIKKYISGTTLTPNQQDEALVALVDVISYQLGGLMAICMNLGMKLPVIMNLVNTRLVNGQTDVNQDLVDMKSSVYLFGQPPKPTSGVKVN